MKSESDCTMEKDFEMKKKRFQNECVPNDAPDIFEGEMDYKMRSKFFGNLKMIT